MSRPPIAARRTATIERAIYVQANNRIFGVVFWFLLLGPAGPLARGCSGSRT